MEDKNPFKFGSVVDGPYFTNRTKEVGLVKRALDIEMRLAGIDFSREHDMPI